MQAFHESLHEFAHSPLGHIAPRSLNAGRVPHSDTEIASRAREPSRSTTGRSSNKVGRHLCGEFAIDVKVARRHLEPLHPFRLPSRN
jgi:hypothetical protein